jgi:hypothetical protein
VHHPTGHSGAAHRSTVAGQGAPNRHRSGPECCITRSMDPTDPAGHCCIERELAWNRWGSCLGRE